MHNKFSRWNACKVFDAVLLVLVADADHESSIVDASYVRAHQHSAAGKGGAEAECIGRSRAGLTTKIHALVDALGNPVHLHITPASVADVSEASRLIQAAQGENFIADKGYDADFVVAPATAKGMKVVIPPKSNRKNPRPTDFHLYKERHLVENFFCKLKHFRRVATRYEKTARNLLGLLLLASIKIWLV